MNVRRNDRGKWVYDFWFNGRRFIRVIGDSKEQAQSAMAVAHRRLQDEKFGIASPIKDIRFDDLAEDYFKKVSQQKRSWRRDRLTLDHLKRFFRGKMVSEITAKAIEDYKERRLRDVQGPTVNREIALLSSLYGAATRWGHAGPTNPCKGIARFEESEPVERILEPDEEQRLLAAAGKRTRAIIQILLATGMRRNELLSARWRQVDLKAGELTITRTNAKSKKQRTVPLNAAAREAFAGIPRTSEFVFPGPTGRPIRDIKTSWGRTCEKAEITGLRLHDLRHTAATRLVQAGCPITTVQKILGHSSLSMTIRYAHTSAEDMHAAVEKLDPKPAEPERKTERPTSAPEDPRPANYSWN